MLYSSGCAQLRNTPACPVSYNRISVCPQPLRSCSQPDTGQLSATQSPRSAFGNIVVMQNRGQAAGNEYASTDDRTWRRADIAHSTAQHSGAMGVLDVKERRAGVWINRE
ncbi:hypothetical protein PAMP_001406 [Pampus punctatissimus]